VGAERWRLFVALDIPEQVRDFIRDATSELRGEIAGARWVSPRNLHLTLKFIGEFEVSGMERLEREVLAAARGSAPFTAALGGCGAFPGAGRARVIWVGMRQGEKEASTLARRLESRLEKAGVKREERPFRGHLTLARMRHPVDCAALLDALGDRLAGLEEMSFPVDEATLYRSILGPQGPDYRPLLRAALGGKEDDADRMDGR